MNTCLHWNHNHNHNFVDTTNVWQTIEQHVDKKKWIDKKAATARFACSIDNTNGIDGGKKACGGGWRWVRCERENEAPIAAQITTTLTTIAHAEREKYEVCVNEMEHKWIDDDKARQNTATNNRKHQWECKVFHLVLVFKQDESDIFQ